VTIQPARVDRGVIAELGETERDIARELMAVKPLAHPERFEEAHRGVMRALEVLDATVGAVRP
jgi:hypothetical protein